MKHILFMCLCHNAIFSSSTSLSPLYEDIVVHAKYTMYNCVLTHLKKDKIEYKNIPKNVHEILNEFKRNIDTNRWSLKRSSAEFYDDLVKNSNEFKKVNKDELKVIITECLQLFYNLNYNEAGETSQQSRNNCCINLKKFK
ncbi:uncharacterized protein LOC126905661 [Daktulosphaira vitifoliae]|uniref:uncharacterized protein LOC126905661 n=1 Tax=Daktulosphaira vitifoliae TaxID=58002 RepID=UPI0021AAC0C3|nr:uncharacterized protein LOC126905661 [Daktulosphaira vitifoliae]